MVTFEKLSDPKFQSLKKCELSNLAAIVAGAAQPTEPAPGHDCNKDYSYPVYTKDSLGSHLDQSQYTSTCEGDTAEKMAAGAHVW